MLGRRSQPGLAVRVSEATSAVVSLIPAAAMLSLRCTTDPVPGVGRIDGDLASSQASTICRGVALWRWAICCTIRLLSTFWIGA